MDDRVEALEVAARDVTDVLADRGHLDRLVAERAALVVEVVEAGHVVAGLQEHRCDAGADVAVVPCDQDSHGPHSVPGARLVLGRAGEKIRRKSSQRPEPLCCELVHRERSLDHPLERVLLLGAASRGDTELRRAARRPGAGRSSSRVSAARSPGGTRIPFRPDSWMISVIPPMLDAITAAPAAIAWGSTIPCASSRCVGNTKTSAAAM